MQDPGGAQSEVVFEKKIALAHKHFATKCMQLYFSACVFTDMRQATNFHRTLFVLFYCITITQKPSAYTYILIFVVRRLSRIGKRTLNMYFCDQFIFQIQI